MQSNVIKFTSIRNFRRNKIKLLNQIQLQSMVWPGIIFLIIFAYVPMYGITIAFKDYDIISGVFNSQWVGLKYFKEFFIDQDLFLVLKNTLGINVLGFVIGFPAPIILALLVNELSNGWFKKTAQTISYLPHFVSWVIFGGMIIDILSFNGPVNATFLVTKIINEPINFLGDPNRFWFIAVISNIIKGLGFNSILYIAAISGVDQEIYEAAKIDGCNRFQKIIYITLPSIMGTIVIVMIFSISSILNSGIEQILMLQNSLNISASETLDTYVYKIGLGQMRFSYATAVGLFKSVISVILLFIANTTSKKITQKGLF